MKYSVLFITVLLLSGVTHGAVDPNKLPASVRRVDRVKDAQSDARQQKKAVMFVLSEMTRKGGGAGNALVLAATQQLFQKLRSQCVIIYVDFNTDRPKLAKILPKVNDAFDSKAAQGPIPRAVVTDAAGEKIYAIVPYAPVGPLGEEMLKEAKQQILDALAGKVIPDEVGIQGEKKREIGVPPPGKKKKKENNDRSP